MTGAVAKTFFSNSVSCVQYSAAAVQVSLQSHHSMSPNGQDRTMLLVIFRCNPYQIYYRVLALYEPIL